jgi:COP9 signalosome complex subunit 5
MTSQLGDLVAKLGKTDQDVQHRCNIGALSPIIAAAKAAKGKAKAENDKGAVATADKEELPLAKAVKDR